MKKSATPPRKPGVSYAKSRLTGAEARKHEIIRAAARKLRMVAL